MTKLKRCTKQLNLYLTEMVYNRWERMAIKNGMSIKEWLLHMTTPKYIPNEKELQKEEIEEAQRDSDKKLIQWSIENEQEEGYDWTKDELYSNTMTKPIELMERYQYLISRHSKKVKHIPQELLELCEEIASGRKKADIIFPPGTPDWKKQPRYLELINHPYYNYDHLLPNTREAKECYDRIIANDKLIERNNQQIAEQEQADKEMADLIASEAKRVDKVIIKKKGLIKNVRKS